MRWRNCRDESHFSRIFLYEHGIASQLHEIVIINLYTLQTHNMNNDQNMENN